ncbi:glutamate receptor ionotropic, kainate glr-3-like [Palaemon carinicauda]|uniref:glutamate receptor ionotropic, kainate glr-3-like n=1 Tax=Palaemon carinicauda TaxID=392227 RepID=UPI0035B5E165
MFASDNWQTDNAIAPDQFFANSRFYFLFLDVFRKRLSSRRIQELLTSPKWKKTQRILMLTPASRTSGGVDMYGRCLHCAGGELGVEHLETWTPKRGFLKRVNVVNELLSNFHGHVFKAVTMDFAPFIDYTRTIDGPGGVTIPKDSMDIRILQEAARLFNFSFILREPADNQWGYLLENGSWTGTVGTIQRSEADFSMMLSVTWERTYAVSFTREYYVEPMTFVMRKPGPLPQWQAPIKPFTWEMWIYLAVVTILSGPALWLIFRLVPKNSPQEKSAKGPGYKGLGNGTVIQEQNLSFGDICLYMIAPILAQPSPLSLRSSSGRAFCGMWWFFCILTTTLYRGSLIARITVPELSPALDTLEQLADSSIEWGMLDTYGSGYQLFRASTVPVYMKLFEKMHFYNEQISMGLVLKGGYAFISWKTFFRNLIARDYTNRNGETKVRIARQEFFPGGFGWAFPKDSPYKEKFDRLFQRLREAGLIRKWMRDLILLSASESTDSLTTSVEEEEEEDKGLQAFTVYHLQGVFFLMVGGYLLAGLFLIIEIFFGKKAIHD